MLVTHTALAYSKYPANAGCFFKASLIAQLVKNLPATQETLVQFLGREDPLEKEWQPTPALLPGKPHGWRNLVGYSPGHLKDSDMTE